MIHPLPAAKLFKAHTAEIKAATGDARTAEFTITTGAVDRDNDTIAPGGWKLDSYLKNPTVLFGHDYGSLPVARALSVTQTGKGLTAVAEFPPKGTYAFADTVFEMVKAGFLNATSVGFRPVKWLFNEERRGFDFEEQELLEFSIVPVPANAEALALRGVSDEQVKAWKAAVREWAKDDTLGIVDLDLLAEKVAAKLAPKPAEMVEEFLLEIEDDVVLDVDDSLAKHTDDLIDINEASLRAMTVAAVETALKAEISAAVRAAINRHTGRVD